ncbi:DUF1878 family protein [Bacillus pumilus]|uniref:DUF1878 family protein n=1 Tax=Bacillus pumilus TaxID=1408 RepID=UPI0021B4A99E|nr:DUF1878 family protein [Bacillus pumilus]
MSIEEGMREVEYYMEVLVRARDMRGYGYYGLLIREEVWKEEGEEIEGICGEV